MGLFSLGDFVLNSGHYSPWKIDCNLLTDNDIDTLAKMIHQMVGPFTSVEGVPLGGLRLANALMPLAESVNSEGQNIHLIVDDVLTTGKSMEKIRTAHCWQCQYDWPHFKGAVIFARGQCPSWIKPVFQMPQDLWLKKE